ncbi:MAG: hypothetical protein MI673_06355, partial [Thiotrichales bacterium]|nr:hypothetical protein [Thiotrichales bacterium]
LAYATVLPAVLSTTEFLSTFRTIQSGCQNVCRISLQQARAWSLVSVLGGSCLLLLSTLYFEVLYPLVWITPVFIVIGVSYRCSGDNVFSALALGNWQSIVAPALAALVCGFFWELWNSGSYAHWKYSVPYVQAFHLFEMPALGYAGYLPFGLTCLAVSGLLPGSRRVLEKQVLCDSVSDP